MLGEGEAAEKDEGEQARLRSVMAWRKPHVDLEAANALRSDLREEMKEWTGRFSSELA